MLLADSAVAFREDYELMSRNVVLLDSVANYFLASSVAVNVCLEVLKRVNHRSRAKHDAG
jgi:hypothetical protein